MDARGVAHPELAESLNTHDAIEYEITLADEDRIAEAQRADLACDFAHMRGIEVANLADWQLQFVERDINELKLRQNVISARTCRGRRR